MAPLAVSPRTLGGLRPVERRRWVAAATVTGLVLTSPQLLRSDAALASTRADLPSTRAGEVLGAAEELLPGPTLLGVAPFETPRSGPVAPTAVPRVPIATDVTTVELGGDQGGDRTGALPDGIVTLARAGAVTVATEGSTVELVGFHESSDPAAIPMTSTEPHVAPDAGEGPVVLLPTRGRAGAPTSAVDIAVRPGQAVMAPVTGEVVEVASFALYGSTRDLLVRIRSAEDPDVVVTAMHLEGAAVEVGDTVEAGVTPIADEARQLPFDSQIDRFTAAFRGEPAPHVHVELQHA